MDTNKKANSKPDPPKTSKAIFNDVVRLHEQHKQKEEHKEESQTSERHYMATVIEQIRDGFSFGDIVCSAIASGGESYAIVRRNWPIIRSLSEEANIVKKYNSLGKSLAVAEYKSWCDKLLNRYAEFFDRVKLAIPEGYTAVWDSLAEYKKLSDDEIDAFLNVAETDSFPSRLTPAQRELYEKALEYNVEIHTNTNRKDIPDD